MVVLYPIVLVAALYLMFESRQRGLGVPGRRLVQRVGLRRRSLRVRAHDGRNVALVLFAAAAIAIFWLSVNAPYWREVAGFPVGVGLAAIGVVLFG